MYPRVACFLVLLGAAGPAAGQGRTFSEAQCSYTPPGPEWEWLDPSSAPPGEGTALAHLRHPDGRTFTLRYQPHHPRPDADPFGTFGARLLSTGGVKLDSRHRLFKGETCSEIDVWSDRADECIRVRVLFANDNAYQLAVTGSPDRVGDPEDTDPIFEGFEFRPPEERTEDEEYQAVAAFDDEDADDGDDDDADDGPQRPGNGRAVGIGGGFGLLSIVGFFVWLYRTRKSAVG